MASPVIDDQFWFDQSKIFVEKARESRDQAAIRLQGFAGWAWGIFSAATGLAAIYTGKPINTVGFLVIGATSFSLLIVYWLSTSATIPETLAFDPRSPTSIEKQYENDIVRRQKKLSHALLAGLVSAILVGLSLFVVASSMQADPQTAASETSLSAKLNVTADGSFLAVSGSVPPKEIIVTIQLMRGDGKTFNANYRLNPAKGNLQVAIPLNERIQDTGQIYLSISWMQSDGTKVTNVPKIQSS